MSQFFPTVNEERRIGGSANFGAEAFVPNITNVTGDHTKSGVLQRMGKIIFWAFELSGTSTTTNSVFTPPVTPQRRHPGATYEANVMSHGGMFFDENSFHIMNTDGTCTIDNATVTDGVRRFSGWYWVK